MKNNLSVASPTFNENLMIPMMELLNKSTTGKHILAYYTIKNDLYDRLRCNLCEIIISYIKDVSGR